MTNHRCMKCGAVLTGDEIALHRKLISRAATEYFCLDCMARYCGVTREHLEGLIAYFHRTGICVLFAKEDDAE